MHWEVLGREKPLQLFVNRFSMSTLGVFSMEASESSGEKIIINVGGVKHETYRNTLMSFPGSRLARLVDTDKPPSELFFDRHPETFAYVLQYYRSGKLHCPSNVCGVLLEDELSFWGISGEDVEPCCWATFQQNRAAAEALAQMEASVVEREEQRRASGDWRAKIWALFDNPQSSISATVIAITSLFFILLSITGFSLQTCPSVIFQQVSSDNSSVNYLEALPAQILDAVEIICSLWFVFEFVIRIISCPSKLLFFKNIMNIVDLLALFPLLFRWCSESFCDHFLGFAHVMRCIRVLRIFKLMQTFFDVRVLKHTLRASSSTLCTVPLLLFSCTLIFGTTIYYIEHNNDYTAFYNIPSGFWWAVVTLTTVGYGDMLPQGPQGKCVAVLCAAMGVLLIILPVPVIVNNFIKFSALLKTKSSMARKNKRSSSA